MAVPVKIAEDLLVPTLTNGQFNLGRLPSRLVCPVCNEKTETRVKYKISDDAHSIAKYLCCIGFPVFAWVPFCFKRLKDSLHYCKKCQSYLGTHHVDIWI